MRVVILDDWTWWGVPTRMASVLEQFSCRKLSFIHASISSKQVVNPCGTFEVTALRSPSWVFWTPGVSTHNEAPVNAGDTPSSLSDLAGVLEVLDLPVACSDLRRRSLTTKFLSTPRSPKLSPCEPRPVLYYKLHHH